MRAAFANSHAGACCMCTLRTEIQTCRLLALAASRPLQKHSVRQACASAGGSCPSRPSAVHQSRRMCRLAAHGMRCAPQPRGVPRGRCVSHASDDPSRRRQHSMAQRPTKSNRDMNLVINVAAGQCGGSSKLPLNGAQRHRAYWSQRIWRRSVEPRAQPRAQLRAHRTVKVTCAWPRHC